MSIDEIIAHCNGSTVEESISRVSALSEETRQALFAAYRYKPDGRFGDNLLLAVSRFNRG